MYDIAIIGAGPAGATLARLVDKNYKILLLDKRQLSKSAELTSTVKCCGGLLAPDAQKILAKSGLGLPKDVLVDPQIFAVRTIDLYNKIEKYYQRFYLNIDREKFDRWLVSIIPHQIDLRCGCYFKNYTKEKDFYKINFLHNGKEYIENAKLIIGADGANSLVRRQEFPLQGNLKKYISIQEWFEVEETLPYFSAIFDPEITDFYSWTIPKGDNLIIGAALSIEDDPVQKFELLKSKLKDYGFVFGKRTKKEGAFILRPQSIKDICTGKDRVTFIGEAAGWISPSSAEGFSYAFQSANEAAQALNQGIDGFQLRYAKACGGLRRNIILKNIKSSIMYNKTLRKMAMSTGIQNIELF